MLRNNKSNSLVASQLIAIPKTNEPSLTEVVESLEYGVFLGHSSIYNIPVFLDFSNTINPHALVIGMTGSGKTYLMKNIMLKMCIVLNYSIILIDFTGEYREFASSFGDCYDESNCEQIDYDIEGRVAYLNLSKANEAQKIASADNILKILVSKMRKRDLEESKPVFVLFDEAWKLLKFSNNLETIIREGRKYRVGLLLSSQLLEDSDLVVTSNIATLFIFRTQDTGSLEKLVKNYNLMGKDAEAIQNLSVGSFFFIRLYKSDTRHAFAVRKFYGMNFEVIIRILLGGKMNLELSVEKLRVFLEKLCGVEGARDIIAHANEKGYLELWWIIKRLMLSGTDRHLILRSLRELGIRDSEIADAFGLALFSDKNGKES